MGKGNGVKLFFHHCTSVLVTALLIAHLYTKSNRSEHTVLNVHFDLTGSHNPNRASVFLALNVQHGP